MQNNKKIKQAINKHTPTRRVQFAYIYLQFLLANDLTQTATLKENLLVLRETLKALVRDMPRTDDMHPKEEMKSAIELIKSYSIEPTL